MCTGRWAIKTTETRMFFSIFHSFQSSISREESWWIDCFFNQPANCYNVFISFRVNEPSSPEYPIWWHPEMRICLWGCRPAVAILGVLIQAETEISGQWFRAPMLGAWPLVQTPVSFSHWVHMETAPSLDLFVILPTWLGKDASPR